ncbi:MAG: DNA polymerase Y family protein [Polyangiaceae bacterium]
MRILAITLPWFKLELGPRTRRPLVIVRAGDEEVTERSLVSGTRISEVSDEAAAYRIAPGDTLARARAKHSDIEVRIVSDKSVRSALEHLAEMLLQYGATVSIGTEPLCTLWVDVTGCTHLHGKGAAGEKRVATLALELLASLGHRASAAIAEGPFLAQLFARSLVPVLGSGKQVTPVVAVAKASTKEALAGLPIDLLPITEEECAFFHHMGLHALADLQRLPKASLAARLSAKTAPRLMGLLEGYDPSPLVPYVPPLVPEERLAFDDDVHDISALGFVLRPMIEKLCLRIEWRGLAVGKTRLELGFGRREFQEEKLAFPMPLSNPNDLFSALRTKLERVTLKAPVREVSLSFTELVPHAPKTLSLLSKEEHREGALAKIVSELSLSLGEDRVGCLAPCESWLLEERSRLVKVGTRIPALSRFWPVEPTRIAERVPFSMKLSGAQSNGTTRLLLRVSEATWWLPKKAEGPSREHDLLLTWVDDKACVVERVHAPQGSHGVRYYLRAYAD